MTVSSLLDDADCVPASLGAGAVARRIMELPGDRSIAFAQVGAGRDCLLIHGTLMVLEDIWLGLASELSRHFHVTAVDRPGHGYSRRQRLVDASPWRQAEVLHEFAVAAGLRNPVVVGHSYGGSVALAYGMLFPEETAGIVALAPMCLPAPRLEAALFGPRGIPSYGDLVSPILGATVDPLILQPLWRTMFLPQTMPQRFSEGFPFSLAARFGQMIAEGEDAGILVPTLASMALGYRNMSVPVRIVGGTADTVVHNATQGLISAAVMPDAEFTHLPGLGHMVHHFAQAEIVRAVLSIP